MQFFKKVSIKFLFIFSLMVLMIAFIILAVSLYAGVIRISIVDAEAYHRDSLSKIANALEIQFENLSRFAASLCYDPGINSTNQGPEDLWAYREILQDLQTYSALNELDSRFTIFLGSKSKGLSSHDNVITMTDVLMTPLYARNREWRIDDAPDRERVSYFQVHYGEFFRRQVSVLVGIDYEPLRKQLEALNIRNKGIAFLRDSQGHMIFSRKNAFTELIYGLPIDALSEGFFYLKKERLRILHTPLRQGLILGMAFPEDSLMESVHKTNRVLILIFLTAMGLFSLLFIFLYKWITHPLSTLYSGMAAVEMGDFAVELQGHHIDEIDYIYLKFNAMAGRIRRLLDEVRLESLRSQEAEFKFLQAQINPHFLYNNLFYIYQMSMRSENEKAGEMAIALSKYFKDVTRPKTSLVPLAVELENLRNYMKIFSLRHPDRFSYHEDVDPELRQVIVPRLLLQPFVENSIVYGLEKSAEPISITITGESRNGTVFLQVSDNGAGIEERRMKELNRKLASAPEELEGCGLKNPLQRLKFRFGGGSAIRLEAVSPWGLSVTLEFPKKLKNTEEESE